MMRFNIPYDLNRIIEKKIIQYSGKIPLSKIKILVAYSGGIDSSILLNIVNRLSKTMNFKYDFVYINHHMTLNDKNILKYSRQFTKKK